MDSLRGFAALGVAAFFHYMHFDPPLYPFARVGYWLYRYGFSLVDFFFILSGFVFTYVYRERILAGGLSVKEYVVYRFSRLYPLHLLTLFIVVFLQLFRVIAGLGVFTSAKTDAYHFLLNVFFIHSGWFEYGFSFNAPAWSISCEAVAYALFFIVLKKTMQKKKAMLCFVGFIFVGLTILRMQLNYPFFNENIARVLIGFFLGSLLFDINAWINAGAKRKLRALTVCAVTLTCFCAAATIWGNVSLGQWKIVYTVLLYPLIILLCQNVNVFVKVLSIRPFCLLGDLSYSLYLLHFPIQILIKLLDDFFMLNINYATRSFFVIYCFISLGAAAVSYFLFEKKMQRYLRKKLLGTVK